MAVPKHKASKSRTRRRRVLNAKLTLPHLVGCSNCGALKLPHRVCPKCGFYRGKEIISSEDLN